jgi:hypothetical protein
MNAHTTTTWLGAALDRCKLILAAFACVAVLFSISVGGNVATITTGLVVIGLAVWFSRSVRRAAVSPISSVVNGDLIEVDDGGDLASQPLMKLMNASRDRWMEEVHENQLVDADDMQLSPQYSFLISNVFHDS